MEAVEDEIEPELASGAIAQLHHARVAMSLRKSVRRSPAPITLARRDDTLIDTSMQTLSDTH